MLLNNRLLKCSSWILLVCFLITGCAPTRTSVRVNEHESYGSMVYQRTFDEHGRPVFLLLMDRPTARGETFSLVEFEGNRPVLSYEVQVRGKPNRDFLTPVKDFLVNIGMSLAVGLYLGWTFADETEDSDHIDYDEAFATGFVIGTGAGILYTGYSLGMDTGELIVNNMETILSETHYSYDEQGRLKSMFTMPPPGYQWESKVTKFFYEGESTVPLRSETSQSSSEPPEPK